MPLHLVATVTLGTRTWRIARESLDLVDEDGARVEVLGHWADPSITLELALLDVATPPEVVVDGAQLPGLGDVLARHAWTEGRGEVALVDDAKVWELRRVLLRGSILDARTLPEDVTAFTIAADVEPPPAQVADYSVTTARWSQAATKAEGSTGPLIFGPAGSVVAWDGTVTSRPAAPAPYVDGVNRRVLVCSAVSEAGDVTILEPEGGSSTTQTISHRTDGEGARVATVVLPNSSPWTDSSLAFFSSWDDSSRGTITTASPGGPILGVGDLCLWLLERSAVLWDRGRWRSAAEVLNAYRVAGAIEQGVDPWAYLLDAVLPLVPVSLVVGPDGVYPIVHRVEPVKADALVALTFADPKESSLPRITLVECIEDAVDGQWMPTHRVRYAYDSAERDYRRQVVVTGDIGRRGESDTITTTRSLRAGARHLAAQVGRAQPEAMPEATLETDLVHENRTAHLIALWRASMLSEPRRRLSYAAGEELLDYVDRLLGAEVSLVDGVRGYDSILARVEALTLSPAGPGPVILTLSLIHPYDTAT